MANKPKFKTVKSTAGAHVAGAHVTNAVPKEEYFLRISRLTVDKLGVKLYDKVSAVVAELVANSYDADAEQVFVRLPLRTLLAPMWVRERGTKDTLSRWKMTATA